MRYINSRVGALAAGAVALVAVAGGGAVAATSGWVGTLGGEDVRNESLYSQDIKNGQVKEAELSQAVRDQLGAGEQGPAGADGADGVDGADSTVPGPQGPAGEDGADSTVPGPAGADGADGQDGVSGYETFTSVQDFGPGGIGGAWCGAPDANTEDQGWAVVGGGATFTADDVNAGVAVVSSWPNLSDPLNPGWNVQVNKPPNVNPGEVTLYAVCVKTAG